jgi:uncharacterized protein DUF732
MTKRQRVQGSAAVALFIAAVSALAMAGAPPSRADDIGYLVNVTVRPGYDFPNADAALAYGRGICDKIAAGRTYAEIVGDVHADFSTTDDFQASYLIGQAADQLCPGKLWQLRQSAGGYHPGTG